MKDADCEGDRAGQIVAAAEAILIEMRSVAITLQDIADRMAVSRSLIYVYFDGVPAILDAIFRAQLDRLERGLPLDDLDGAEFEAAAIRAHLAYLDYLVAAGPVLHLILRERNQDSPLGAQSRQRFIRLARRLANAVRRAYDLEGREALVLIELSAAIPESLARLVRTAEIDASTARDTCARLVTASLQSFAPRGGASG